ncbi:MAG TPA: type II toxin-antitoxin system HicB family antitoxin [Ktedonobacterales bacterium]|nr:type II toxin-antitoxin system HicB family antitoxin [Ktedonobacterales bacterium]
MNATPQYSMQIAWSPKDQAYLVTLPEWTPHLLNRIAVTHGATYEEAARHGQEVLEMLIENAQERGEPLPAPHLIEYADTDDPDAPTPADPHPSIANA